MSNYLWFERNKAVLPPSKLHIEGNHFVNEAGQAIPLRSQSFFLGLLRMSLGEDIRDQMRYARDIAGSNCLRTFILMHYVPAQNGLPDVTHIRALDYLDQYLELAAEEGLYVDLTVGDAQVLLPNLPHQQDFFWQVYSIMKRHNNAALLTLNEPWKNGLDAYRSLPFGITNIIRSRGAGYDEHSHYMPPLDVISAHTERSLGDDGYKWVRHQWEQHDYMSVPVYHEEPIGCAEYQQDGKRDNSPERFAQGAIVGEVAGAGWCFHCEFGIHGYLPAEGSNQDRCAHAVGDARRWFKPETQRWAWTRSGWGDSALVLDDAHALRVYQRLGASEGQIVAVHSQNYVAVAQNGWHITAQNGAFIDVAR